MTVTNRLALDLHWRKSSRSQGANNCIEVAGNLPGLVAVRDSKNPLAGPHVMGRAAWAAFVGAVRTNRL